MTAEDSRDAENSRADWDAAYEQLRRHCRRLTRDVHAGDDLASQVALEFLRGAAQTREQRSSHSADMPLALLVHRARSRWCSFQRSPRHHEFSPELVVGARAAADGVGAPGSSAEVRELTMALAEQLSQLPDEVRHILVLRWRDSLSFAAIAAHRSITERQARGHYARAVALLRRRLAGHAE